MKLNHIYILDCSGSMSEEQISSGLQKIGDTIELNGSLCFNTAIFCWSGEPNDSFESFISDLRDNYHESKLHFFTDGLMLKEDLQSVDTVDIIDYDHPWFGKIDEA